MRGIRLSWSCKEFVRRKCEVFDRVESCKEFVRRNVRYLIRVESCKEFVRNSEVFD